VKVGGVQYISKTADNLNNLVSDTNNWKTLASTLNNSQGVAKAWVTFDGRSGAILDSFNVANVLRTASGCYLITFQTAMTNAFYSFSGSAGPQGGLAYGPGDDNMITGGAPGKISTKTAAQCAVFCYDRGDQATQDSSSISVIFFGS
jgi:hypothetical protein